MEEMNHEWSEQELNEKSAWAFQYRMNSGIRLSKNRKYAACIASDFHEEKRKVEQRAYVFQTHDGQEKLSRLMNTIWNVSFLNEKDELLISGDAAESISFASDAKGDVMI